MKFHLILLSVSSLLIPSGLALTIQDDFNGSSINPVLWNISLPESGSQVFQGDGTAHLISRGGLNSVDSFASGVDISGQFYFAASSDHFRVVFRSDLSYNSPSFEKSGMIAVFNQDGEVQIGESGLSSLTVGRFNPGGWVNFRILDDGKLVSLYANDLSQPLLTASSSYKTGDRVGFYNREFPFNHVLLDNVHIASVPDAGSTALLLGVAIGAFLPFRRKRSCRVANAHAAG